MGGRRDILNSIAQETYPPEVKEVQEERYLHEVDPSADVVVAQHDEALAQLEAGPLQQVRLPVAAQDLLQRRRVDLRRVLVHQLGEQVSRFRLKGNTMSTELQVYLKSSKK